MMDFLQCVQQRRSIRKYKTDPVSDDLLRSVVEAASYAPSWKNTQTTRYIAIKDTDLKQAIAEKCTMDFIYNCKTIQNAPTLIAIITVSSCSGFEADGTPSTTKGTHWESFDAGIATQTLCLAAFEKGLGTVVLGVFDEEKVRQVLELADDEKVSALVTIGYPERIPAMPPRKTVDELLTIR